MLADVGVSTPVSVLVSAGSVVEKHEQEKAENRNQELSFSIRGQQPATLDARGAAIGSVGLTATLVPPGPQ
jgi:hypothetical protein